MSGLSDSSDSSDLFLGSISRLAMLFHSDTNKLGKISIVTPESLPVNAAKLLAHNEHMTVTLEVFHDCLVDVQVVAEQESDSSYAREIVLKRQSDGMSVQYGFMRIWLDGLPDDVRKEIHQRSAPLGRILIQHNLLRHVELMAFWQIEPSKYLQEKLEVQEGTLVYGRTAQILVGERPTVQLLEIINC